MKIYVASSWRNTHYEGVLAALIKAGHQIWNWRNPPTGGNGFHWASTAAGAANYEHGMKVDLVLWLEMLQHPNAQAGFASDLMGMNWCDVGVLLMPSGPSAHLEAGWMAGQGKKVHMLVAEPSDPDLMVLALNGKMFSTTEELIGELAR